MALPSNVLRLISDYSKPVTRPNWRESKPIISVYTLYVRVYSRRNKDLLRYLIYRNIRDTEWFDQYWHIRRYGISSCCFKYGINIDDVIKLGIPGVPYEGHLYLNK
uniref:Uncharacterized protein n=1 Tax=viral metagenome TaxID=1070528 RepID=A0A6C0JM56_9ZZZZ